MDTVTLTRTALLNKFDQQLRQAIKFQQLHRDPAIRNQQLRLLSTGQLLLLLEDRPQLRSGIVVAYIDYLYNNVKEQLFINTSRFSNKKPDRCLHCRRP